MWYLCPRAALEVCTNLVADRGILRIGLVAVPLVDVFYWSLRSGVVTPVFQVCSHGTFDLVAPLACSLGFCYMFTYGGCYWPW